MATKQAPLRKPLSKRDTSGFDVTCVVGRVEIGETGEHSAYEAAFLLIAKHDAPGTYNFPGCTLTVEHHKEPPPEPEYV